MNNSDIKIGIQLLRETTSQVKSFYENDQNIVDDLNKATNDDLQNCMDYYSNKSG